MIFPPDQRSKPANPELVPSNSKAVKKHISLEQLHTEKNMAKYYWYISFPKLVSATIYIMFWILSNHILFYHQVLYLFI